MSFDGSRGIQIPLIVDEKDFDDEQGLRPTVMSCMVTSIARKRKLEIKKRDLAPEELRGMACAKRQEIASWIDNAITDVCVSRGVPRHRIVKCQWMLVIKEA